MTAFTFAEVTFAYNAGQTMSQLLTVTTVKACWVALLKQVAV